MSNVIDFLERLGQDARLRCATEAEFEAALRDAGIEPGARAAILDQDRPALEALLRIEDNVCCLIYKEDEEEEEEKPDEEEEEEEDEDDEKAILNGDVPARRRVVSNV